MDESLHTEPDSQDQDAASQGRDLVRPHRYSEAAQEGRQPPVTCLIPKRPWTLWTLGLLGLVGIAAIENLFTQVFLPAPAHLQSALAGLDVTSRGSIASWYAALLLGLAAATSVLVFALRRHRLDDYRGRYRIWLWVPLALLLASLDAATGLHAVSATLLHEWVGASFATAEACALVTLWTVFGAVGIRLCWEIWSSRLAVVSVFAAVCMYTLSTLIELGLWLDHSSLLAVTANSAFQLLGHLAVAMTAIGYCRFVYLDAQSALSPPRRRRSRRPKDTPTPSAETPAPATAAKSVPQKQRRVRIDTAHEESTNRPVKETVFDPDSSSEPAPEENGQKQLSKAERRRLRKQIRKQTRGDVTT